MKKKDSKNEEDLFLPKLLWLWSDLLPMTWKNPWSISQAVCFVAEHGAQEHAEIVLDTHKSWTWFHKMKQNSSHLCSSVVYKWHISHVDREEWLTTVTPKSSSSLCCLCRTLRHFCHARLGSYEPRPFSRYRLYFRSFVFLLNLRATSRNKLQVIVINKVCNQCKS